MGKKSIVSIEVDLASKCIANQSITSNISLLDWDITIFQPDVSTFLDYHETYLGKPCLDDNNSFRLKERLSHWREQIKDAVEFGKLVVVFLPPLLEVYVATGGRDYSGTGRNQKVIRHVDKTNNYAALPVNLTAKNASGKSMVLDKGNSSLLSSYWAEFSSKSLYKVTLTGENLKPSITTKQGNKIVGSVIKSSKSTGHLLLLPNLDFYSEEFVEDGEWTDDARKFAARLISELLSIEKAIRSAAEETPQPQWAASPQFDLSAEGDARELVLKLDAEFAQLQERRRNAAQELKDAGRLRGLLYEKGSALEQAILEALQLLGFSSPQNYDDGTSEFDAIFSAEGLRLIGEAEGKDEKAVSIDKIRQLITNVQEDFAKDDVDEPAKGVLFGNGYRLMPLDERSEPFTEKCKISADRNSVALVFTPDLFSVVQYLSDHKDPDFAKRCRQAIVNTTGRVDFPECPAARTKEVISQSERS